MKITYRWLSEFAPLASSAEQLAAQLTLAGLEVESVTPAAPPFTGVVVGRVLGVSRHPDAEKLSVCEVTTDGTDRLQIICGASNVRADLAVAVATVGARLPGGVHIKRAKLRGLESRGMLCSARELGLGLEHDGIMELDPALRPGGDLRAALELEDWILEVNATPNRGDCMSVFGIARDYAAAQARRSLHYTTVAVPARHDGRITVRIDAGTRCPVFGSRVIRGIRRTASPAWLRERLRRVGVNSISPVVDVTNYVMLETGQPLHAYDLNRLSGGLAVRAAAPGESITLLDDESYTLNPDYLVIADDAGAVGVAGIMGGRRTAIADDTVDVVLEAAHFVPEGIVGRARRLGLFTDAAQRFERGVDPTLPARALERASALIRDIVGGDPGPVSLVYAPADGRSSGGALASRAEAAGDAVAPSRGVAAGAAIGEKIDLRRRRLTGLLGVAVPDAEVAAVLSAVTGAVESTVDGWRVRRPPHRFDLRIEVDLIEEVARLRGFDLVPESHAIAPQIAGHAGESRVPSERWITAMVDLGYCEVITYTFVEPDVQRRLFPGAAALALVNPISPELSEMRVSLWPGLMLAARDNLRRQQSRVRLFEAGRKFEMRDGALHEIETLAGLLTGARWPEQWGSAAEDVDFYDAKADLAALFQLTGDAATFRFEAATLDCLRPGRTARIHRGDATAGWLGELHPRQAKDWGYDPGRVLLFELEIESAFKSKPLSYVKISKFPSVRRDLAIVVDEAVTLAELKENVTVSASGLLSELRVFDVYRGPKIEIGRKSVALSLILQDSSRTLTDVDADAVITAVVTRLRDGLSATIRDQ